MTCKSYELSSEADFTLEQLHMLTHLLEWLTDINVYIPELMFGQLVGKYMV